MKQFPSTLRYQSSLISALKKRAIASDKLKKAMPPIHIDVGTAHIFLPRNFGFCYGVENAIEMTHQALEAHPNQRIFLLSELIHNPYINQYFQAKGVKFLMNTRYEPLYDLDDLTADDIIIIPAFGAPLYIEKDLARRGLSLEKYQTTCPFVVKVWNRGKSLAEQGFTILIHGTVGHEETESTRSRIALNDTPYLIIKNLAQAKRVAHYLEDKGTQEAFEQEFQGAHSKGFDIRKHLTRLGVINQTTMIATETQEIMNMLRASVQQFFQLDADALDDHFAKTRDTLCYATNDNQRALQLLLEDITLDIALAVGGYNSSNTSHLAEMCASKTPTYFIHSEENLTNENTLTYYDFHQKKMDEKHNYLAPILQKIKEGSTPNILLVAGASCPDIVIEHVLRKLCTFIPNAVVPDAMD